MRLPIYAATAIAASVASAQSIVYYGGGPVSSSSTSMSSSMSATKSSTTTIPSSPAMSSSAIPSTSVSTVPMPLGTGGWASTTLPCASDSTTMPAPYGTGAVPMPYGTGAAPTPTTWSSPQPTASATVSPSITPYTGAGMRQGASVGAVILVAVGLVWMA